ERAFCARQLDCYVRGREAGIGPQSQEVIEQIGAFADEPSAVAANPFDEQLDCFLAELLRDLRPAAEKQPGGVGGLRVAAAARIDHAPQAIEHGSVLV